MSYKMSCVCGGNIQENIVKTDEYLKALFIL